LGEAACHWEEDNGGDDSDQQSTRAEVWRGAGTIGPQLVGLAGVDSMTR